MSEDPKLSCTEEAMLDEMELKSRNMGLEVQKASEGSPNLDFFKDTKNKVETLKRAFATTNPKIFQNLILQVSGSFRGVTQDSINQSNLTIAHFLEFEPKDHAEALLIGQMISTHNLMTDFARRSLNPDLPLDLFNSLTSKVAKLGNLYAQQMQTLDRHRNGHQQKIEVQHLHVDNRVQNHAESVTVQVKAEVGGVSEKVEEGPLVKRKGQLKNGNPNGDPSKAPRCGAKAKQTGQPCKSPAMRNGRCRLHGGKSTGPRTAAGKARAACSNFIHGEHSGSLNLKDLKL